MTIYVAPTGSDSTGTGTLGNPYKTVSKASTNGDRHIQLRGGTYAYQDNISNKSGSSGNPYIIENYPAETPVYDGTTVSLSQDTDALFKIHKSHYVIFRGITVQNSDNGSEGGGRGIHYFESTNITISNCTLDNIWTRAIGGSGDHIIVEYCVCTNCVMHNEDSAQGSGGWAAVIAMTTWGDGSGNIDVIFRYNTITNCWGEGLGPWNTDGFEIYGNVIDNAYSVLIYCNQAENGLVYNNVGISDDPDYRRLNGNYANGLQWSNENLASGQIHSKDNTAYNNVFNGTERYLRFYNDGSYQTQNTYDGMEVHHCIGINCFDICMEFDNVPSSATQPSMYMTNCIWEDGPNGSHDIADLQEWTVEYNCWVDGVPGDFSGDGDFSATPEFEETGAYTTLAYYQLTENNSAIYDNGKVIAYIPNDAFGSPYGSSPDPGIHEFGGEPPVEEEPDPENPPAAGKFSPLGALIGI